MRMQAFSEEPQGIHLNVYTVRLSSMDTPYENNKPTPDAERLSDILSRVGKYVEAEHTEPTPTQTAPPPEAQEDEQPNLPLAVPNAALPVPPEYIRSEAFLE